MFYLLMLYDVPQLDDSVEERMVLETRRCPDSAKKSVILVIFIFLVLNTIIEPASAERIPEPRLDRPYWTSPPQNQTIEYGTHFYYQVNISQPTPAFKWFISDTKNFRIDGEPFSAVIRDNAPLALGTYILGISVWDMEYSNLQAWIIITVSDTIHPSISNPEDMNITRGSEGNILTWELFDLNPVRYQVFRNNILLEAAEWTEPEVSVDVVLDFITTGTYYYEIRATDIGGNVASDIVKVEVLENTTLEQPSHHPDVYAEKNPFGGFGKYAAPKLILPVMELFAAIVLLGLAAVVAIAVLVDRDKEWGFD
jgi:hypothetical protein